MTLHIWLTPDLSLPWCPCHAIPTVRQCRTTALPGKGDARQKGRISLQKLHSACHGHLFLYTFPYSSNGGKQKQGSWSKICSPLTRTHKQRACFWSLFALRVISNTEKMLQAVSRPTCRETLETWYPNSPGRLPKNAHVFSWACTSRYFFMDKEPAQNGSRWLSIYSGFRSEKSCCAQ